MISNKPTYEQLEQRVSDLIKETVEQKRSLEQIEMLSVVLEHSATAIAVLDSKGIAKYVNPKLLETYKINPDEVIGNNWQSFLSKLSGVKENYSEIVNTVIEKKEKWQKEISVTDENLKNTWKQATILPLKNTEEELSHIVYMSEDITARKAAEKALRQSEQKYGNLFRSSNDVILLHDLEGNIIDVNQRVIEKFGYTMTEILSVNKYRLHPQEALEKSKWALGMINRYGFVNFEIDFKKKDGETFTAEVSSSLFQMGEKKVVQTTVRDITEIKRAEEALRKSHEILNGVLSASPVGIGLIENTELKWVNDTMMEMFGIDPEEKFKIRNFMELFSSSDKFNLFGDEIYEKLKAEKTFEKDIVFKRRNGSAFVGYVKMSCQTRTDRMENVILTVSDISWRTEAEAERQQKEKLQGALEFAETVCHELHQPLQGISGCSELLMMNIEENNPLYVQISMIHQQISRIGDITRKLSGIARHENKNYLEGKPIDIDQSSE